MYILHRRYIYKKAIWDNGRYNSNVTGCLSYLKILHYKVLLGLLPPACPWQYNYHSECIIELFLSGVFHIVC